MTDRTLLIVGSTVALILTTALAALFLFIPLLNPEARITWAEAGALYGIASVGIASAGVTFQSARHGGKWGWVGLVLGLVYIVVPWTTPYFAGVIHWLMLVALPVIAVAVANTFSRGPQE